MLEVARQVAAVVGGRGDVAAEAQRGLTELEVGQDEEAVSIDAPGSKLMVDDSIDGRTIVIVGISGGLSVIHSGRVG